MNEGTYVYFLNSVALRGRTPERVARTHQDGKEIAKIECGDRCVSIRFLSEPLRIINVPYTNISYIEERLEAPKVTDIPPPEISKPRIGRPPKIREEVQTGPA